MHQLLDKYGHQVSLGNSIVYAVKHSCDVSLNYGYVYGIDFKYDRYSLKITALSTTWRGVEYTYKTTLTANNFIVAKIPDDIKEKLMKEI